jgi:hypothetical protein
MSFIKRNYILNADITGGSSSYPQVDTYADLILIDPAEHVDEVYLVKQTTGNWITGIYNSGLYMSNGTSWIHLNNWTAAFSESNFEIYGNSDETKKLTFRVSNLPTATEILLTSPTSDGTIATEDFVTSTIPNYIADSITNGVVDKAPSENAVFDALALKADLSLLPRVMKMTTGDQTTTSNVAANVTDLIISVSANKRYRIHGVLHIGCSSTGGVKVAIGLPTGASMFVSLTGRGNPANTTSVGIGAIVTSASLSSASFCIGNSVSGHVIVDGEITVDSTAGNIQIQFASGVNTQTSTIYQQGSLIEITEV